MPGVRSAPWRATARGRAPDGARPVVSFASNDYLGLTTDPEVVAAAHRALDRWGAGAGASRLVTGSRPVHAELESALAAWKGCDQAAVFPTGFAANLSVLSVFGTEGAHVFSDELNHASIIDGCRLGRAAVDRLPARGSGSTSMHAAGSDVGTAHHHLRHRVLHGRGPGRPRWAAGGGRPPRRPVGAGRGPRRTRARAVPGVRRPGGGRPPDGHAVQDPRLTGRVRRRPGPVRGAAGQPGPPLHLHHGHHPGRRRRRTGRRGHRALAPGRSPPRPAGRPRGPGGRGPWAVSATGRRSSRWSSGTRPTPSGPRPTSWTRDCGSRPSDRPRCPRGTSRLRITLSAAHTDEQVDRLVAALGGMALGPPHRDEPAPTGRSGGARAGLAS